jgi:hypothetical protein
MSINRDGLRRAPANGPRQAAAAGEYAQDSLLVSPTAGGTGWEVEAEHLDRGGGLRSWFVVRHGDQVRYGADRRELAACLDEHGVAPADIAAPAQGLPPGEDGCE